eukprot:scaffold106574_cov30-Phaeocystis_antarctica.AAC.1
MTLQAGTLLQRSCYKVDNSVVACCARVRNPPDGRSDVLPVPMPLVQRCAASSARQHPDFCAVR